MDPMTTSQIYWMKVAQLEYMSLLLDVVVQWIDGCFWQQGYNILHVRETNLCYQNFVIFISWAGPYRTICDFKIWRKVVELILLLVFGGYFCMVIHDSDCLSIRNLKHRKFVSNYNPQGYPECLKYYLQV